ncbi:hypothetical protein OXX79_004968 [Metschnikowia pulcherrima]
MTLARSKPSYAIRNGVRSVAPYFHEYRTPFKERWRGKSAPQILQRELGQAEAAVRAAIESGHIYVTANNGKAGGPVSISGSAVYSHELRGHDIIHNLQHCHEPKIRISYEDTQREQAVDSSKCEGGAGTLKNVRNIIQQYSMLRDSNEVDLIISGQNQSSDSSMINSSHRKTESGILILYESDTLVIISKPGGIPTHPGGIYRYNSMSEIIAHDLACSVWPCHRLDKSTSGVMVFAKNKTTSSEFMALFQQKNDVEKWYMARVRGKFPYEACMYTCPLFTINTTNGYINVSNQSKTPTNSSTEFYQIYYSSVHDYSIVLCRPVTGRMHQIRIHLRNLGHPIENDKLYNGKESLNRIKNEIELQIYSGIWDMFPAFARPKVLAEASSSEPNSDSGPTFGTAREAAGPEVLSEKTQYPSTISLAEFMTPQIEKSMNELSALRSKRDAKTISGTCDECNRPLYNTDLEPDSGIWLHALAITWRQTGPSAASDPGLYFVAAPIPSWCV